MSERKSRPHTDDTPDPGLGDTWRGRSILNHDQEILTLNIKLRQLSKEIERIEGVIADLQGAISRDHDKLIELLVVSSQLKEVLEETREMVAELTPPTRRAREDRARDDRTVEKKMQPLSPALVQGIAAAIIAIGMTVYAMMPSCSTQPAPAVQGK